MAVWVHSLKKKNLLAAMYFSVVSTLCWCAEIMGEGEGERTKTEKKTQEALTSENDD